MVGGNSCDSTVDQLEAVSPQHVLHLLGFMCQHPCRRQRVMIGGEEDKGGWGWRVKLLLCKLGTCWKVQSYCNRKVMRQGMLEEEMG